MGYVERKESAEEERLLKIKKERDEKLKYLKNQAGINLQNKYFPHFDYQNRIPIIIPKRYPNTPSHVISSPLIDVIYYAKEEKEEAYSNYRMGLANESITDQPSYSKVEDGIIQTGIRGIIVKVHALPEEFRLKNLVRDESYGADIVMIHNVYNYKKTIEAIFKYRIRSARIDDVFSCSFYSEIDFHHLDLPIIGFTIEQDLCCYFVVIPEYLLKKVNILLYEELNQSELTFTSRYSLYGSGSGVRINKDARGLCINGALMGTSYELESFCFFRDTLEVASILDNLSGDHYTKIYNWRLKIEPFIRSISLGDVRLGKELWGKEVPGINYYLKKIELFNTD